MMEISRAAWDRKSHSSVTERIEIGGGFTIKMAGGFAVILSGEFHQNTH